MTARYQFPMNLTFCANYIMQSNKRFLIWHHNVSSKPKISPKLIYRINVTTTKKFGYRLLRPCNCIWLINGTVPWPLRSHVDKPIIIHFNCVPIFIQPIRGEVNWRLVSIMFRKVPKMNINCKIILHTYSFFILLQCFQTSIVHHIQSCWTISHATGFWRAVPLHMPVL